MLTTAAAAKLLQSCPTLCDPRDGSPPGSPIPGILQVRTLEWVAISFSKCMKVKSESEVAQSCLTLSNPMDCSLPGSSAHGICQARVLEWAAIAFSGWSLAWRIFSMILLVCEMSAVVWYFEHSSDLAFFGIRMKTDLYPSYGHCWVLQIFWHIECSTFTA